MTASASAPQPIQRVKVQMTPLDPLGRPDGPAWQFRGIARLVIDEHPCLNLHIEWVDEPEVSHPDLGD